MPKKQVGKRPTQSRPQLNTSKEQSRLSSTIRSPGRGERLSISKPRGPRLRVQRFVLPFSGDPSIEVVNCQQLSDKIVERKFSTKRLHERADRDALCVL